jgi:hypothetical protein
MKNSLASLFVGFLFALGLGLSGMTQPQKVVGFLDVFGNWDPSLMFVMMGAISVHFVLYKVIRRRKSPLFSMDWQVPSKKEITPALVLGAFIFGIGWGLGGYCPGPAITSLASFEGRPLIFVISMLIGMLLFNLMDKKLKIKR